MPHVLLTLLLLASACGQPQATPQAPILLRLAGSTSMQPLLHELGASYSAEHPHVTFDLISTGSDAGLELLRRGSVDLALVSRLLQAEEEHDLATGNLALTASVIAEDGIAVIVNARNRVTGLTMYQLRRVFEGQVRYWEELQELPQSAHITVVSREDGSGTRAMFETIVMEGYSVTRAALVMPSSQAMLDYVAAHEEAIGYLSLAHLGSGVRALAVDGVLPTRQAVEDGTYPIVRPFLLVTPSGARPELDAFVAFVSSPAGQAVVRQGHGGVGGERPR